MYVLYAHFAALYKLFCFICIARKRWGARACRVMQRVHCFILQQISAVQLRFEFEQLLR